MPQRHRHWVDRASQRSGERPAKQLLYGKPLGGKLRQDETFYYSGMVQ